MSKVTAYEQVQAARDASKISIQTLIDGLTEDFFDCHGDRQRADDPAVIAGLATIAQRRHHYWYSEGSKFGRESSSAFWLCDA
nr:hypothetical protein [Lactiplantibacillus plantarum]